MNMISVITPVYNGVRFMECCIKVVFGQNYPEVEHIIIDGGSTDGTFDVIKKYAEKYPHIRWISEKDQGQSDAMNKGIGMAKGEILNFLNVDDFYEPGVLNRVGEIFKTLPEPSLLVGNCNVCGDNGELKYINKPTQLGLRDLLIGKSYPVNPSAYFYHKLLHQKIGLYKTDNHYVMDVDFLLRAVQEAKVRYVDEVFGNFRLIEGTKTFESLRSDKNRRRVERVLKFHRQSLPLFERFQITLKFKLYKKNKWRYIKYFKRRLKYYFKRSQG